jgi:hypothetical protein
MTQVCDLPRAERKKFSSLALPTNETERAFRQAQVKQW